MSSGTDRPKPPIPALRVVHNLVTYLKAIGKPLIASDLLAREMEAAMNRAGLDYQCSHLRAGSPHEINVYSQNALEWTIDIRTPIDPDELTCREVLDL